MEIQRAGVRAGQATLTLLGVLMVIASGLPARAQAAGGSTGGYVALGDSYTSGPFIPDQVDTACQRSDHDYPALVAAGIDPASFTDVSCSGAVTGNMAGTQVGAEGQVVPPEFDALRPGTALVTVGIGGNDIDFAGVVATCAALGLTNLFGAPCEAHYTAGGSDQLAAAIAATGPRIAAVLAGIHRLSPHARVLLVGYPALLPEAGGCWPFAPFAAGDLPYLRGVELELNQMLAAEAAANAATYVDTYTPSVGHDMCQFLAGREWVEGLIPWLPAAPVHPNVLGMQADAADILATLRSASTP